MTIFSLKMIIIIIMRKEKGDRIGLLTYVGDNSWQPVTCL